MKTLVEFKKLSDQELKTLLIKQHVFYPSRIKHAELIDRAINQLHGIEFLNSDEKLENNKIIKIFKLPKITPGSECPNCKQKTMKKLKTINSSSHFGYIHCGYCGLYLSPSEQKRVESEKPKSNTTVSKE